MNKLDTLEPDFRPQVEALIAATENATGKKWAISDARRSMAQQATIYAQGRTKPGKVVSNAPPGSSAHNFGLAVDLWPLTAKGDFDWSASDKLFRVMANIAKEIGLTPGYYFSTIHDAPHVEHPRWRQQRALWREGKLEVA
jgi:peptidoglycan L-alanyl-D-glutamate endopeptidase CwlK